MTFTFCSACSGTPHPAVTNGSSDWDGSSSTHLTSIQYTCADACTRSYAWCGPDGIWHYTMDRTPVCHDDGSPPPTMAPPTPMAITLELCKPKNRNVAMQPNTIYTIKTLGFPRKYPSKKKCTINLMVGILFCYIFEGALTCFLGR